MSDQLDLTARLIKANTELSDAVAALLADRDRLAGALAEANAHSADREQHIVTMAKGGAQLLAELSAARADAERYRWLRDKASTSDLHSVAVRPSAEIDAAIDAARTAPSAEGPRG